MVALALAFDDDDGDDEEPFSAAWHAPFIVAYVDTASIPLAAKRVGVSNQAVYKARGRDERFARALYAARSVLAAEVEGLLIERCRAGDTIAIIFANKNLNPEIYSDRVELRGTVSHRHELEITGGVEPAKINAELRHEAARLLLQAVEAQDAASEPVDAEVVDPAPADEPTDTADS